MTWEVVSLILGISIIITEAAVRIFKNNDNKITDLKEPLSDGVAQERITTNTARIKKLEDKLEIEKSNSSQDLLQDERIKNNTGRIKKLEESFDTLNNLILELLTGRKIK